jgi:hypothetical protein
VQPGSARVADEEHFKPRGRAGGELRQDRSASGHDAIAVAGHAEHHEARLGNRRAVGDATAGD